MTRSSWRSATTRRCSMRSAGRRPRSWPTRWTPRWPSARRSRPSTCSSRARPRRRSLRACAAPAACSWALRAAPRSATTWPAPTTRCRPAGPRASPPGCRRGTSGGAWRRSGSAAPRPRWPGPERRSRAPRGSRRTPSQWRFARIPAHERADRGDRTPDGGDERRPEAGAGRLRCGHARDRRRLPRPHAGPAGAPRRAGPGGERAGRPADRLAPHGRGHRDRARAGARPRARRAPRDRPLWLRRDPDGRVPRRVRDRRLRPPLLRLRGLRATPGGRHRGLRARGGGGVLPRRRVGRAVDAACQAAGRHERAPHDRGVLQGVRPRAAGGRGDRPGRDGRPLDQGHADVVIAIVDYGMGNRRSVEKALEHVGARSVITSSHDEIRAADGVILPGVGAFPEAMRNVAAAGLDELLRERAASGAPLLGICLGQQLLFERSDEHEGALGLGLLGGSVTALRAPKLPHIGWNLVTFARASVLTEGLGDAAAFYHVHSFACRPSDEDDAVGRGEYGEPFASIVERGNVYGVQFHPEKSSRDGLALLANFARVCARVAA